MTCTSYHNNYQYLILWLPAVQFAPWNSFIPHYILHVLTHSAGLGVRLKHQHASQFPLHHSGQMRQGLNMEQLLVDQLEIFSALLWPGT